MNGKVYVGTQSSLAVFGLVAAQVFQQGGTTMLAQAEITVTEGTNPLENENKGEEKE